MVLLTVKLWWWWDPVNYS